MGANGDMWLQNGTGVYLRLRGWREAFSLSLGTGRMVVYYVLRQPLPEVICRFCTALR
jgi:hypothetical protein